MSLFPKARTLLLVGLGAAILVSILMISQYTARRFPIIWLSILSLVMVVVPLIAVAAYRITATKGLTLQAYDRIRLLAGLILAANFYLVSETKDHALIEISDIYDIGYTSNLGAYQDRYLDEEYVYIEYRSTNKMLDLLLNNIGLIVFIWGLAAWSVIYVLHPSQRLKHRPLNAPQKILKS